MYSRIIIVVSGNLFSSHISVKFNIDDLENSKAGSVKLDMSDLSIILAMPELMDRLEEPRSLLQHMDFAFTVDR